MLSNRHLPNEHQDSSGTSEKHLSKFEIPLNGNFLHVANNELNHFKSFLNHLIQMNQSALTNKISFAENLAFRLLGTIDWDKANFDELKQFIDPFLNSNHLNLNHLIFKENGKFIHLKQPEAHEAIHTWTCYRTKMNAILIDNPNVFNLSFAEEKKEKKLHFWNKNKKIEGAFETLLDFDDLDERVKEIMILYLIAKWSKDDSSLKFSTFFHYGIPRARARQSTLPETSLFVVDESISSGASSLYDASASFSNLSSPSSSSSKLEDNEKNFESKKPGVHYYSRPRTRQLRQINRSPSFVNAINNSSEKENSVNETKNVSVGKVQQQQQQRADLKYVSGGVVATGNVYFPLPKK